MSDTPETDDIARGNHIVPTEWAQQLECERDKANEDLHKQLVQFDQLFDEAEKIRIERDEARKEAEYYKERYEQLKDATK